VESGEKANNDHVSNADLTPLRGTRHKVAEQHEYVEHHQVSNLVESLDPGALTGVEWPDPMQHDDHKYRRHHL